MTKVYTCICVHVARVCESRDRSFWRNQTVDRYANPNHECCLDLCLLGCVSVHCLVLPVGRRIGLAMEALLQIHADRLIMHVQSSTQ